MKKTQQRQIVITRGSSLRQVWNDTTTQGTYISSVQIIFRRKTRKVYNTLTPSQNQGNVRPRDNCKKRRYHSHRQKSLVCSLCIA